MTVSFASILPIIDFIDTQARQDILPSKSLKEWIEVESKKEVVNDVGSFHVLKDISFRKIIAQCFSTNEEMWIKKLFREAIQEKLNASDAKAIEEIREHCIKTYQIVPSTVQKVTQFFDSVLVKSILVFVLYQKRAELAKITSFWKEQSIAKLMTFQFGRSVLKVLEIADKWRTLLQIASAAGIFLAPASSYIFKASNELGRFFICEHFVHALYHSRLQYLMVSFGFVFSSDEEFWIEESVNRFSADVQAYIESNRALLKA